MNCLNHPETPAVAYCRTCGKALCQACQRASQGIIFCEEHLPAQAAQQAPQTPWTAPPPPPPPVTSGISPGLAFVLGLIPGVGAIYNGQYVKGVIHVVILGLLISIQTSSASAGLEPLFGMLIAAWFFYMAFEAYHTAKRRAVGEQVDEFSSLVPLRGRGSGFPVGPLMLIALGVLFLLHNLGLFEIAHLLKYWPVFLIALGAYMLYARIAGEPAPVNREATHEHQ